MNECCLCRIELEITDPEEIELQTEEEQTAVLTMGDATIISQVYPDYEGPYIVTPILNNDTILETQEKTMRDDITVKAIPVVQTTNPYGGQTVVIG